MTMGGGSDLKLHENALALVKRIIRENRRLTVREAAEIGRNFHSLMRGNFNKRFWDKFVYQGS
jgi:hypothetical protein